MRFWFTLHRFAWVAIIVIGIRAINVDAEEARNVTNAAPVEGAPAGNPDVGQGVATDVAEPPAGKKSDDLVEVEPSNMLPSDVTGIYYLIPYRNRRETWGKTASLGYSSYKPLHYEPNYIAADFADVYGNAELPLIELSFSLKRNFLLGAVGAEFAAGIYNNTSDPAVIESKLNLIPLRLGGVYYLDNLFFEPYVVPYASGGAYVVMYRETSGAANSFSGNTQAAFYYTLGVQFQLNWIDREAARISYLDSGVENTFLYVAVTQYMKSSQLTDPDLSTSPDWAAGMRLEF